MAHAGDVLEFLDGSEFRITKAAADTGGESLEMEWFLPSSTEMPPKHIHPDQREEYTVIEGALDVLVEREWRSLGPGDSASAPPGAVHTFKVPDGQTARVLNVHAPSLDFEDYFAKESALMRAGKIKSYTSLRAAIHWAVLLRKYRRCMVMASPGLRGLLAVLFPLGRLLGYGKA
jgi:quercetin dioxygenase-like cupin family protein